MIQSFNVVDEIPLKDKDLSAANLDDEKGFVRFIFEEYLRALELYLQGQGHHGFAGHALTIGHALIDLFRMGYPETARKGLGAYRQFIQRARNGAQVSGPPKLEDPAPQSPCPLDRDYWVEKAKRPSGDDIVNSHLIKYPYSFYALLRDLTDDALRQRALQRIYYLTAVS